MGAPVCHPLRVAEQLAPQSVRLLRLEAAWWCGRSQSRQAVAPGGGADDGERGRSARARLRCRADRAHPDRWANVCGGTGRGADAITAREAAAIRPGDRGGTARMKWFALGFIRLYQRTFSRLLPPSCRFVPSCSEY